MATRFHLRRSESRPSTLITVGMPAARVTRHSGLFPAMKNSATSGLTRRDACTLDSSVCTNVSRYLLRTVGRCTSFAPFHSRMPGSTTCGRQYTVTVCPRAVRRLVICSTAVSKPL